MNVAIPVLKNQIAPCFEAAKQFEIITTKNKKIVASRTIYCSASEGFIQVRLLRLNEIHTLICNGIKSFYLEQLSTMGVVIIPKINLPVKLAFNLFLSGELKSLVKLKPNSQTGSLVSHESLISWAKELFLSKGYSVSTCTNENSFLIDLIARINCPVCQKRIEVAICCGAQIYKADQEIKEFYHATKTQFDSIVYVYLKNPQLEKSCNEYGINFLSPESSNRKFTQETKCAIPILHRPIEGHEKAFGINV